MKKIPWLLTLAALVCLVPWFAVAPAEAPKGRSITLGDLTFSDHGTKDVKGQGALDLEADNFYFEPTFLRGAPGQKLKLEIENKSSTLHNFSILEQQVDVDIPRQGKAVVEVTFPPSGVVRFFCKFHPSRGMNGELLSGDVQPQAASPRK